MTVTVTAGDNQKQFEISISISKRIVNYQISANKNQEYCQIDLYTDEVVATIAPTFDLQSISVQDESIVLKENLSGSILTIMILNAGNTSISINTNKVDIIINISVK